VSGGEKKSLWITEKNNLIYISEKTPCSSANKLLSSLPENLFEATAEIHFDLNIKVPKSNSRVRLRLLKHVGIITVSRTSSEY